MDKTISNQGQGLPVVISDPAANIRRQPVFAIRTARWMDWRHIGEGETRTKEVVDMLPNRLLGFTSDDAVKQAISAYTGFLEGAAEDGSNVIFATGVACLRYGEGNHVDIGGLDLAWNGNTPCAVIAVNDAGQLKKVVMLTGPNAAALAWDKLISVAEYYHSGVPKNEREKGVVYLTGIVEVQSAKGDVFQYDGIPAWQDRSNPSYFAVLIKKGGSSILYEFTGAEAKKRTAEKGLELSYRDNGRVLCCTSVWCRTLPVDENMTPPACMPGPYRYVVTYTQVAKQELAVFDGLNAGEAAIKFAYALTQDRVSGQVDVGIVFASVCA